MKKLHHIRKILPLILVCFGSLSYGQNIHDQIMERIRLELYKDVVSVSNPDPCIASTSTPIDTAVGVDLAAIQTNGSWNDIDYADMDDTNTWEPRTHLRRLFNMANAYSSDQSAYYNSLPLYDAIVNGLNYFYAENPEATSWYYNEIEVPILLGQILILARGGNFQVPAATENNILNRLDSFNPPPPAVFTGFNKIQYTTWFFYNGLLRDSVSEVNYAVSEAFEELVITTGEGIQHDSSFHQHGPQLNLLSYGKGFVDGINTIAKVLQDTPYELSGPQLNIYRDYVLGSFSQVIRGRYSSFSLYGRSITRKNKAKFSSKTFEGALLVDPTFAAEYQTILDRLNGVTNPSDNVVAKNSYLYRSHFTAHNRTDYNFDIRATSTRTKKAETRNGENLKGRFLADGSTNILVNGNEYYNIFPVWDWSKIPGTTVPEYSGSNLFPTGQLGDLGVSTFSGGVSDGNYGAQVFDMDDYNTQAKKSWFLFDEEIVCLGTGINSTASEKINTTINQSHLDGPVVVSQGGSSGSLTADSYHYPTGVDWVLHDSIGYFIPNGGNLKLSKQLQSGSWYEINEKQCGNTLNIDVFKMWFDHGISPSNDSYAYIIAPGKTTAQQMNNYNLSNVTILQNDSNVQAVKHNGLDMIQVVFYTPGTLSVGDITLSANRACTLIFNNVSTTNVSVSAADPSENFSNLKVSWSSSSISPMRDLQLNFLTSEAYKGSTVQGTINLSTPNTPEAGGGPTVALYPEHDAFVKNGPDSATNYGSDNKIVVKRNATSNGREGFIQFDLSGVTPGMTSAILKMKLRGTYTGAVITTWDVSSVTNDNWTEGAITWDTKPVSVAILDNQPGQETGYVAWDVTSFVNAELGGDGKVSLRISSTSLDHSTYAAFDSKEDSNIGNRPVLELEYPSIQLYPEHDAFVKNGPDSATNYGSDNKIVVKRNATSNGREGFIQFDLSGVSSGSTLTSATLKMKLRGTYSGAVITTWDVSSVTNDSWTEGAITWDNKPASGAVLDNQPGQETGYVEWDVTSFVNSELGGDGKVSLRISSTSLDHSTYAAFDSKEDSNIGDRPVLELSFSSPTGKSSGKKPNLAVDLNKESGIIGVYPNPVEFEFTVESKTPITQLSIADISGKTIKLLKDVKSTKLKVDVTDLHQGMYFLRTITANGTINTHKIIIK